MPRREIVVGRNHGASLDDAGCGLDAGEQARARRRALPARRRRRRVRSSRRRRCARSARRRRGAPPSRCLRRSARCASTSSMEIAAAPGPARPRDRARPARSRRPGGSARTLSARGSRQHQPVVRACPSPSRGAPTSSGPSASPRAAADAGSNVSHASTSATASPRSVAAASAVTATDDRPLDGAPAISDRCPRRSPPPRAASRSASPVGGQPLGWRHLVARQRATA